MAGTRAHRRGFSRRLTCDHTCYAPVGADGPCIYCGTPMFWDREGWIAIELPFMRSREDQSLGAYFPAIPVVHFPEPVAGYYEQVAFQPANPEPSSGYYEDIISWPQKSTRSS